MDPRHEDELLHVTTRRQMINVAKQTDDDRENIILYNMNSDREQQKEYGRTTRLTLTLELNTDGKKKKLDYYKLT